ncbi:MAG: YihY/virulence factor BrkB family protein [Salinisphaera sp.]|jgi:membrane protein|nr:YihY/virulence factor BrkB family protein [Salinisphaera sp.]
MEQDRGRDADAPWQIPVRGWLDILRRAWKGTVDRNLSLVAGGVTFYLLLAVFPGLAALVSVYGLVANPADVAKVVQSLSGMLPSSIVGLVDNALTQLASASRPRLGLGAIIGIVIALWSSVRGMAGMMAALNIAYDQPERRGFIRLNATAVVLTLVVVIGGLITFALVAGLPVALNRAGIHGPRRWIGLAVEWPLLIVFVMGMMALIYRYGPDRSAQQWQWASLGVIVATILWAFGSVLFSAYIYYFNSYNQTYGSLGLPLILLSWMWLSVFVVLFGAEINGEIQRQTHQNTEAHPGSSSSQQEDESA